VLSKVAFVFGFSLLGFVAPGSGQVRHEYTEVHMGMPVRLVLFAPSDSAAQTAARAAFRQIAALDDDLTDYRPGSELEKIESRPREWVAIKPTTFEVLARALAIAQLTGGAFDPTIGPLTRVWRAARKNQRAPEQSQLDSARALVSHQWLQLDSGRTAARLTRPGMRLDLGGIAKGFILQQALATLERHGITQAMLEAGGDIVVGAPPPGQKGWRIDVPDADSSFQARARELTRAALATSGPQFQYVEIRGLRYSHVIDPDSGTGLTSSLTAHVIAPDGATADALATAFTVLGPERARTIASAIPGVKVAFTHR
jgi:FAD:protein FMN transferase